MERVSSLGWPEEGTHTSTWAVQTGEHWTTRRHPLRPRHAEGLWRETLTDARTRWQQKKRLTARQVRRMQSKFEKKDHAGFVPTRCRAEAPAPRAGAEVQGTGLNGSRTERLGFQKARKLAERPLRSGKVPRSISKIWGLRPGSVARNRKPSFRAFGTNNFLRHE